jgi:hypothetical protein
LGAPPEKLNVGAPQIFLFNGILPRRKNLGFTVLATGPPGRKFLLRITLFRGIQPYASPGNAAKVCVQVDWPVNAAEAAFQNKVVL